MVPQKHSGSAFCHCLLRLFFSLGNKIYGYSKIFHLEQQNFFLFTNCAPTFSVDNPKTRAIFSPLGVKNKATYDDRWRSNSRKIPWDRFDRRKSLPRPKTFSFWKTTFFGLDIRKQNETYHLTRNFAVKCLLLDGSACSSCFRNDAHYFHCTAFDNSAEISIFSDPQNRKAHRRSLHDFLFSVHLWYTLLFGLLCTSSRTPLHQHHCLWHKTTRTRVGETAMWKNFQPGSNRVRFLGKSCTRPLEICSSFGDQHISM